MSATRTPTTAEPERLEVRAPVPLGALAGLSVVELEVGSRCNRACSYCPVSLDPRPPVPARMSDEVFVATVRQLAEASFAGRVSYHLYNEPLLRRDLARLVAMVDDLLPDALQLVNTNGDLLDDARYTEPRRAGVDYFYVTRHEPGPYPERVGERTRILPAGDLERRDGRRAARSAAVRGPDRVLALPGVLERVPPRSRSVRRPGQEPTRRAARLGEHGASDVEALRLRAVRSRITSTTRVSPRSLLATETPWPGSYLDMIGCSGSGRR